MLKTRKSRISSAPKKGFTMGDRGPIMRLILSEWPGSLGAARPKNPGQKMYHFPVWSPVSRRGNANSVESETP